MLRFFPLDYMRCLKQPAFDCRDHCGNLVTDPQFLHRTADMEADRAFGQAQDGGDVRGGLAQGRPLQDFGFPRGQFAGRLRAGIVCVFFGHHRVHGVANPEHLPGFFIEFFRAHWAGGTPQAQHAENTLEVMNRLGPSEIQSVGLGMGP